MAGNSFKLVIQAGKATPAPPIGPALGQRGLNIMDFCKKFNDMSKGLEGPIPTVVTFNSQKKTFDIQLKTQPASYLIMKTLGITKASTEPGKKIVATITATQLLEIAKKKMQDLCVASDEAAIKVLAGTATSMGIKVDYDK